MLLVLVATPENAHPDVAPKELPPASTAQVMINLTHGCDNEELDPADDPIEEAPTTRVFCESQDGVGIAAPELDGWSVVSETGPARIVWSSADPAGVAGSVQLPSGRGAGSSLGKRQLAPTGPGLFHREGDRLDPPRDDTGVMRCQRCG